MKVLGYVVLIPIGIFFGAVLLVAAVPIIIFFVVYNLYLKLIAKLRGDPKVTFKRLVDKEKIKDTQTLESAIKYFEMLTDTIAREGGAVIGVTKESTEDPEDFYNTDFVHRVLVYKRVVKSEYADVGIELKILEMTDDKGKVFYSSAYDDEDPELANVIWASISFKSDDKKSEFDVRLEFDDIGSYFCIGILMGGGWRNERTGQFWSHLSDKKIWVVRYNESGRDFGFRRVKSTGRVRMKWFDEKMSI